MQDNKAYSNGFISTVGTFHIKVYENDADAKDLYLRDALEARAKFEVIAS